MSPQVSNSTIPLTPRIVFGVLVLVSILVMTLYAREGEDGPLHAFQDAIQTIATPLGSLGAAGSASVDQAGQALGDLTADASTLSGLREQNAQLRELAAQNEEYRQEAERLQELLNLNNRYGITGATGHVIGRSTDAWNQSITIDVGSDAGVEAGMTVMAASGVVGQVTSTEPSRAEVRLLTDPQSGAAALLQSSRAEGIVRGSLDGLLYLENISADTDVQAGDVVLTSGLGGSYVSGLLIGTVARVEGSAGDATRRILVVPNSTAHAMEEVTVVFEATTSVNSSGGTARRTTTGSSSSDAASDSSTGGSDTTDGSSDYSTGAGSGATGSTGTSPAAGSTTGSSATGSTGSGGTQ